MSKVILGATLSLDGCLHDRHRSMAALNPDLKQWVDSQLGRESIQTTGTVIIGRNAYAMAEDPDFYAENYEYQAPIFVLTHRPPTEKPKENDRLTLTFVTEGIESALAQAKAAAGEKDVNIIGAANTARQVLNAGLADELHIDIMPVLLCGGLRLFAEMEEMEPISLERMRVVQFPGGRTYLRFRIVVVSNLIKSYTRTLTKVSKSCIT